MRVEIPKQPVAAGSCRLLEETLDACGVAGKALLAKHGIKCRGTANLTTCELSDALNQTWEEAVAISGNPAAGLGIPPQAAYGLGTISQLVLSAATIKDALDAISRHIHTISRSEAVTVRREGDRCLLELDIFPGSGETPAARYDFFACALLQHLRSLTGCSLRVLEYRRPGPRPGNTRPWEDFFGRTLKFESPRCIIVLPDPDVRQTVPTASATIFELCDQELRLTRNKRDNATSTYVRRHLEKSLKKGDPRREELAAHLGLSSRSLSRRLAREGTSFAELVNEVRRDLAKHYLKNAELSPNEITFALGFGDPSNFYRACKRWFGCTPNGLRGDEFTVNRAS